MKRLITVTSILVVLTGAGAIVIAAALSRAAVPQGIGSHPLVTKAEYEKWQRELSNWERWGKDDELGTLNLITPVKRKQAAALVKDGVSISLASNESTEKEADNPCPIYCSGAYKRCEQIDNVSI